MRCMLLFVLLAFAAVYVQCTEEEDFKCQVGVPYIENECNGCFCSETGVLGCTLKGCLGPRQRELHNCQVGSTWKKDCNDCICVKNMGTICTSKKC